MERFIRSEMLLGHDAMERLSRSHIAVFGLGGVGSYTAEALARAGIGTLSIFDPDVISESNINRQLLALSSTVGIPKVEAAVSRLADINPELKVNAHKIFFDGSNAHETDFSSFDYVVDAIDSVSSKLLIAELCRDASVPLISSMGTGNKLDPSRLRISDISKTSVCPLARVMRRELKARGITECLAVWSDEAPSVPLFQPDDQAPGRRSTPGSVSFVPPVAGLMMAGEVIRYLCSNRPISAYLQKKADI